jgi:glyoxylase-like metal-dependent hydrolase (beta-lactamase superfamily II)
MTRFNDVSISRRRVLAGASAAAAALAAGAPALAKAPMLGTQAPAFYRFRIGAFEATVVSDGPLVLGEPKADIFKGVSKEAFSKALTDNFLSVESVELEQNALVVNTGDRLVLFDTGDGGSKMFGPKSGRLIANLKAAGIDPKDIDAIALTHAHADHCWGLLDDKGARNFPNAQIHLAQSDLEFWTDEKNAQGPMTDMLKSFIAETRKRLLPNRDRMVFFRDGQEFLPGIQAVAAPGHTVGHTVFMITSQGKTLCNSGDLAHHHILVVEQPRLEFAFDTDGQQAVASRLRIFDMLAAGRIPVLSYHFPWPGLGYLAKRGEGFRYFPSPLQTVL